MIERARGERFRLMEVLHRAREVVEVAPEPRSAPVPVPNAAPGPAASEAAALLTGKLERLGEAMAAKVATLRASEQRAEQRLAALERLELKLTNAAAAGGFADADAAARELEALTEVEAAAREAGAGIAEDVRRRVAQAVAQADKLQASFEARLTDMLTQFEARLEQTLEAANTRLVDEAVRFEQQMSRMSDKFDEQARRVLEETRQGGPRAA